MKKHQLSLNYISNRLKQIYFQKTNPEAPWLTSGSIELLNQLVIDSDIGLEFGSGRSTKWLAARCHLLYSIENHPTWFEIVSKELESFDNVKYYFKSLNKEDPVNSSYIDILNNLSSESLDFILNDGKLRGLVSKLAVDKLKKGGLFILDNAERYICNNFDLPESIGLKIENMLPEWTEFTKKTEDWRRIWTSDGVSSTLIFFKR